MNLILDSGALGSGVRRENCSRARALAMLSMRRLSCWPPMATRSSRPIGVILPSWPSGQASTWTSCPSETSCLPERATLTQAKPRQR